MQRGTIRRMASEKDDNGGGGSDDTSGNDDNSGDGNSNDPSQNCDFNCQLQQAEQNALNALQNPDCANLIDGGTGVAADTLMHNMNAQAQGY
jgi:hypothetical protein